MITDQERFSGKYGELSSRIIRVFYDVYKELGYGFLESVYQEAMRPALLQAGMEVEAQVPIAVNFRGTTIGVFRADLVVNGAVLIELKACDGLVRGHESQTLNYLRSTVLEVGLLMNFGPTARFKRLVMDNEKKMHRSV